MSKRATILVIISIAVILVLCLTMVSITTLAYVAIQARPDTLVYKLLHQKDTTIYDENDGVVIASVEPDSPADQAGIVQGDILLEIDNMATNSFIDLARSLEEYHSGDQIELKVLHGDDLLNIKITLDEREGRAYLGITAYGGQRERLPTFEGPIVNGIIITEVISDSPADQAGLQAGEWIISIEGEEVNAESDLAKIIGGYQPGDTIDIEIHTIGEDPKVVQVSLGQHPDDPDKAYLGIFYHPGVGLRGFDRGRIPNAFPDGMPNIPFVHPFELPEGDISGAIITEILADSPAEIAELKKNDIITAVDGTEINNPSDLTKSIHSHKPGDEVNITILRPGEKEPLIIAVNLSTLSEYDDTAYLGVKVAHFIKSMDSKQQDHFEFLPNFEDLPFFDENNSESPHLERIQPGGNT